MIQSSNPLPNDTFWDVACNLSEEFVVSGLYSELVVSSRLYDDITFIRDRSDYIPRTWQSCSKEEQFMFVLFCGHLEGEF